MHTHAHAPTRRHDRLTRDRPGRSHTLKTFGRKSAFCHIIDFWCSSVFLEGAGRAVALRAGADSNRTGCWEIGGVADDVMLDVGRRLVPTDLYLLAVEVQKLPTFKNPHQGSG